MPAKLLYLDHNATTPPRPEVIAAMAEALENGGWGNPSSTHAAGRAARDRVERARRQVAARLGVTTDEVVFTSGGTEANNAALRGLALAERARRAQAQSRADARAYPARVLSSRLEHASVLGALQELEREGFVVDWVGVSGQGGIDRQDVRAAVTPETVLVTLATANHELGNVYPTAAFAKAAHAGGALFHTDVVQAVGRVPVDLRAWDVDAATVSAHKLEGPKGAGALFVRRTLVPHPLLPGGHQERERRGGTENVPGIVGFGVACQLANDLLAAGPAIAALRDRLEDGLLAIPGARVHGDRAQRTPGTCNVAFADARGELVVIGLDLEGVCVSTGSACTSGSVSPSEVLLALGLDAPRAREAVRFSLGRDTAAADIEKVVALTAAVVDRVRRAAAPRRE